MVTIRWSNGQEDSADTWQELLDRVRKFQWSVMPEDEFRGVIAKRAWRWTLTSIDAELPPAGLFAEMERAKLIEIIDEREEI